MGFVVYDVDRDHDAADRLLVGEFGEPAAKVKSNAKGFHYWYPATGELGCPDWLCGEIRGSSGYIIPWHLEDLLDQLESHSCLRSLNQADISETASLKPRPEKTKIETMLSHVESDDYGVWIKVGMALQSQLGNSGLAVWEKWSRKSDNFQEGECGKKWRGFNEEGPHNRGHVVLLCGPGWLYKPSGGRPMTAGGALPTLDRIVRVGDGGAETMFELTTGETMVIVSMPELCNQARFRTAWYAATGEVVRVKQSEWDKALSDWWSRAEVVYAPNVNSEIWSELEAFCTDSQAMEMEELLSGLPYTGDDGITWFNTTDFLLFLKARRNNVSVQRAWIAIRAHVKPLQKTTQIKGKRLRLVGVPAFDQQTEALSVPKVHEEEDF